MTSSADYKMHGVDGPHEISRQAPLSDRKDRRKELPSKPKQRRRAKTAETLADQARPDADGREADDATPENRDDHAVDYYA